MMALCKRAHEGNHDFHEVLNDFAELVRRHFIFEDSFVGDCPLHLEGNIQFIEWIGTASKRNYAEHLFAWLKSHIELNRSVM